MHLRSFRVAGLVGAALLSSPAWSAYDMQGYFPLATANSWTYLNKGKEQGSSRWGIEVKRQQFTAQETVNGVTTMRLETTETSSNNESNPENYAWSEDGLKLYRMGENLCTTPLTLLPRQMEIGTPLQSSADCGDGSVAVTHTLQSVENVSVEAGNFADCLKLHLVLQGSGWSSDETSWYCPNVGKVKSTWTDVEGTATYLNSDELRWATIGGTAYGGERSIGAIRTAYAYGNFFEDSTMEIYNLSAGGQNMSARFGLDPARVFFAYRPQGGNGTAVAGVSLANAYIKMNGADLSIYDVELSGAKYLTTWELQTSPEVGFTFKSISPMP